MGSVADRRRVRKQLPPWEASSSVSFLSFASIACFIGINLKQAREYSGFGRNSKRKCSHFSLER